MKRLHIPPIERDTLTFVGIRVAVRMVASDARRHADAYAHSKPLAILHMAERQRLLFPLLYQPLVYVAKAIEQGYTLSDIRCMDVAPAPRALHKRRPI